MQPSSSAFGAQHPPQYPGWSRRVLRQLETPSVKVEEMVYAPGLCVARHSHDTSNFIYTIAGAHWSGHSRGGEICAPRTVRFLPAGEPHENYFPVGCRGLHIELRKPFLQLAAEHGRTICAPGELARPSAVALCVRLLHEFRQEDCDSPLDIEAVMLQLLLADEQASAQNPTPRRGLAPVWLLRIREMLRDQEHARLTLTELSRRVGRHPVQISRQFHHHFGCTISEYMRRVRIARAQSLLCCRDFCIAEIALACGFSDQSHFTTAFRRITGMPPHRYRLHISSKPHVQESA
ncbi:MAG: helix-turn-helix domain-containing protein [Candidatus Acidiferrales bacterium]